MAKGDWVPHPSQEDLGASCLLYQAFASKVRQAPVNALKDPANPAICCDSSFVFCFILFGKILSSFEYGILSGKCT